MQFPKYGKSGLPLCEKSMGKQKHFKFMGFLNISYKAEIHTIPRTWEKLILIIREKYGKKTKHSKAMGFSTILGEAEIIQFPKYGKSEFP